jgi:hypothetical protein
VNDANGNIWNNKKVFDIAGLFTNSPEISNFIDDVLKNKLPNVSINTKKKDSIDYVVFKSVATHRRKTLTIKISHLLSKTSDVCEFIDFVGWEGGHSSGQ